MKRKWVLVGVVAFAVMLCGLMTMARVRPTAWPVKGYVCGRQGDIVIIVEHRRHCVGDSRVTAGANVTLAYAPTKKRK